MEPHGAELSEQGAGCLARLHAPELDQRYDEAIFMADTALA